MRRLPVFALVLWLGNTSSAVAGETLLASAARLAREAARAQAPSPMTSGATSHSTLASAQQGPPALAASGMSKRMKVVIWLAAGAGFAAAAYTIDHKSLDNTPSTLGTRKD